MDRRRRVLFLCTENSARSQMAEGLLRHSAGSGIEVRSAGTEPAEAVHPLAVRTLAEMGIDISNQAPKRVDAFIGEPFDLIITTCDDAREHCPFFPGGGRREHWSLRDPATATGTDEERLEAFRAVARELKARVQGILPSLSTGPSQSADPPEQRRAENRENT